MPIHVLSDLVVAQIAAGEVVERPASVVKELAENSLDSGATNIRVSVSGGGRQLLRVSDNGSGIRADEVEVAFARHATSKLQTAEDLNHLLTLGFRGEALCSIAAVSQLSCLTRHQSETHGTKLLIEGGSLTARQTIGAPVGTIIAVENLFYNVPARLKFLKKDATEKRLIAQTVTLMAMAFPHVKFVLDQDERESFRSPGTGKLEDVLVAVYGPQDAKRLTPVDAVTEGVRVQGYTSENDFWRTDRSRIHLFVNGRLVQDNNLTFAVTQAYQTVLQQGQYPTAVLMVTIAPEEVDVNVHPTKAEVRFRDPSMVFLAVQRAVREAIVGRGHATVSAPDRPKSLEGLSRGQQQPSLQLDLESAQNVARIRKDEGLPTDEYRHIPEGVGVPENPRTLPVLRVVGQVGAKYIIAEGPAGVYLIDQHNAHARVNYNQMRIELSEGRLSQVESIPGISSFAPAQARILDQAAPILAVLGVETEPFGPNTFRVIRAPAILDGFDSHTILQALIPELRTDDPQESALRALCRLSAVKSGQTLTLDQMQSLVRRLERTPEPFSSPDGSPTILHLSSDQLSREFSGK